MDDVHSKLKEILETFEKQTDPINEFEIEEVCKNLKKEVEKKDSVIPYELQAEMMAFGFSEKNQDRENGWGTYYGPTMSAQYESGEILEYPNIKHITEEIIKYWSERAINAKHPVLKSRYADLAWDFSRIVTGNPCDPGMARIVIDATIDIANKKLHKYDSEVTTKLERALSLSLSLNDIDRIKKVVETTISYEDSVAQDDKLGLWGFSFDLLIGNRRISLSEDQEKKILSDLEERLNRVSDGETIDPFAAEAAAMRLAKYYRKLNQSEKVKEILSKYGNSFLKESEKVSALVGSAWLKKVYSTYLNFGLKSEAESIANKLRKINQKCPEELKPISHEIEIPEKTLEKYISSMLEGDLGQVLTKIAFYYIPKRGEAEEQIKVASKEFALQYLVSTVIQDHKGRPVAQIGPLEDDLEGHIIKQISQNISFSSVFFHAVIKRFKEKFSPSNEALANYLYKSPVFDENKKKIISKGLKAYLDDDYIAGIHLLIPQIEDAFRNLVEKSGGTIYKPSRSGGFNLKTFDEILRDQIITNVFDENASFYLRILFTDPRGWNLRNSVSHGLIPVQQFTFEIADRVFHGLLLLGQVRPKKNKNSVK